MKKDNKKFIKHDNSKVINHNKDLYDVSDGNIRVLEVIPKMMQFPEWRKRLRELACGFEFTHINSYNERRTQWK